MLLLKTGRMLPLVKPIQGHIVDNTHSLHDAQYNKVMHNNIWGHQLLYASPLWRISQKQRHGINFLLRINFLV